MRGARLIGIIVAGLVALVLLVLLAVRLFVNPNDFKGRIVAAVRDSTGRELSLPGDIRLAVLPSISLELGPASLGNPNGFSSQPFATLKRVALHVALLPLLHKELKVGSVEVEGLDLRLEKNPAGKGNWEDFGTGKAPGTAAAPSSPGTLGEIGSVLIRDSRISYQGMSAEQVSLTVGRFASGTSTPLKATLVLRTAAQAAPLSLALQASVRADLAARRYALSGLTVTAERAAGASPALACTLSAPQADLDLAAGTLDAPAFTADVAGAQLSGALHGTQLTGAPQFNGTFQLAELSPRALLPRLGIALPVTRDPRALSALSGSGAFSYGGNAAAAKDLQLHLDESTLKGSAAVTDLAAGALAFDLSVDHIDIDRYRAPEGAAPPVAKPGGAKGADLPTEALKSLRLEGKLAVGSATVAGVRLTQVSAAVTAKDGVTRIAPVRAALYGGTYAGDVTLDGRAAVPLLKLEQTMTGIDTAPLVKDFAKSDRFSGRGNVVTNLSARGSRSDELLASLAGRVTANLDNGAIAGVDLWFEINRAVSLIQRQALPAGQSSGRTRFDTFKASADIAAGIASTKDLSIVSQNLRIAGQGTTNLVSSAISYQVKATVLKDAAAKAGAAGNVLADIPVDISGTLAKPQVKPDLAGLAKSQLQQQLDKHKGDLQQKLQDQLKNILK